MPRSARTRRRRRGRIRAVQLEQSVGAVKLVLFVVIVAPTDSVFETLISILFKPSVIKPQ